MGCGLRKEIEDMLSLVKNPSRYRLECHKRGPRDFTYMVFRRRSDCEWSDCAAMGSGETKARAMRALLDSWRDGKTMNLMPQAPASSANELKLKLAIRGNEDDGTRS